MVLLSGRILRQVSRRGSTKHLLRLVGGAEQGGEPDSDNPEGRGPLEELERGGKKVSYGPPLRSKYGGDVKNIPTRLFSIAELAKEAKLPYKDGKVG